LNNLISELKDNMIVKQEENVSEIIEQFKVQKKLYSHKINNINSSRKIFKNQINLYQEYLVNKEYNEHKRKGSLSINDDAIFLEEKEFVDFQRRQQVKEDDAQLLEEQLLG